MPNGRSCDVKEGSEKFEAQKKIMLREDLAVKQRKPQNLNNLRALCYKREVLGKKSNNNNKKEEVLII